MGANLALSSAPRANRLIGEVWWLTDSGQRIKLFLCLGRCQAIIDLMGSQPVVARHQVITDISLCFVERGVSGAWYPF